MTYRGKYSTELMSRNFGGINRDASIVNIGNNQAYDILNWDIGQRGTIKRRYGWTQLSTIGDAASPLALALFSFPDGDAVTRFAAVAYNVSGQIVAYEAASPSGPWTECAGGLTFTVTDPVAYVGIPWKGKLYIVNGGDPPAVLEYGVSARTLKDASLLSKPTRFDGLMTGAVATTGTFQAYGIAAITPRGKTDVLTWPTPVSVGPVWRTNNTIGAGGIDGVTTFFTMSWDAVPGASAYEIYVLTVAATCRTSTGIQAGTYVKIDEVPYGTTTWQDTAQTPANAKDVNGNYVYGQTASDAYNTPRWENYGYPTGGMVWGRGRSERLLLWRGDTIYGCGVSDPLLWWNSGDSIVFTVLGNGDVEIVAGATLFDYLVFFSQRQCWVFNGSGPQDISMDKNIQVGCVGPHALTQVGQDIYLFSQFGPTTFKRIIAGADVSASHSLGDRVKPIVFEETNSSAWNRVTVYSDISNSRVVWILPEAGETQNGMALVYQYDTDSFTKYDGHAFHHVIEDGRNHYALTEQDADTNAVAQLHTGNTDNGTAISATYKTGWFDRNSWQYTKRIVWVDVVASREHGAYSFSVSWNWDYGQYVSSPIPCTHATTDGALVDTTSSLATEHRIFTDGIGNAVQLIFTTSAGDQEIEILGWNPDLRSKGLRKL